MIILQYLQAAALLSDPFPFWTLTTHNVDMKKTKFEGLQKIRAGYLDGQLSVEGDIVGKYIGDFTFDDEEYLE